jgi:hypothetical protein
MQKKIAIRRGGLKNTSITGKNKGRMSAAHPAFVLFHGRENHAPKPEP